MSADRRPGTRLDFRAAVFMATALLTGCALWPAQAPPAAPLAPPAGLGRAIQAEQILRIAHGERSLTLQCAVGVSAAETVLSCFTALGQRVFQLRHDGQTVRAESAAQTAGAGSEGIPPERILADLQLAYWPLPALVAAFESAPGAGWQVTEPATGLRRLRRNGALHAEVHYTGNTPWTGRLWLVNFEQRYSLDIESRPAGGK